ncbi:MAG: hypothetical protein WC323_04065 [Patescibacteria group bacterium]|jgi:hypothetical protein
MDIYINLDKIIGILELPTDILLFKLLLYVGWIPVLIVLLWGIFQVWIYYIQGRFGSKREFIFLAIDIPTGNEQSPKAVEYMFAHLAGAHSTNNLIDTYWIGKTQDSFSFEIVSIEGYTQFLVKGEKKYQDLMEAMVYAQYPDAEITEVDDYTQNYPDRFPDDAYDLWGGEWVLVKPNPYPIRTYLDFEHQFSGEFKDPMAAMMELFSNLRKGEQCWFQIIVTPIGGEWEKEASEEISHVIGEKIKSKKNIVDKSLDGFLSALSYLSELIIPLWGDIEDKKDEDDGVNMLNLKPNQKKAIEAIQQKVSKIGFKVKIRFIYIAEKEVFDKTRANSFVGVMKQYGMQDLNQFKPDMNTTITSTSYFWKESRVNSRKSRIIQAYKSRSNWLGKNPGILNTEELATIWHFPVEESVKAPMLQKIMSRKTEAPSYLPVEGSTSDFSSELGIDAKPEFDDDERREIFSDKPAVSNKAAAPQDVSIKSGPPENLPIG